MTSAVSFPVRTLAIGPAKSADTASLFGAKMVTSLRELKVARRDGRPATNEVKFETEGSASNAAVRFCAVAVAARPAREASVSFMSGVISCSILFLA